MLFHHGAERKEELEIKNQKLVDAFQTGLTQHMERLRVLVEGGVGVQQEQLRTLDEQLQTFLKFKDQVLSLVHFLLHHSA